VNPKPAPSKFINLLALGQYVVFVIHATILRNAGFNTVRKRTASTRFDDKHMQIIVSIDSIESVDLESGELSVSTRYRCAIPPLNANRMSSY
jgi:hypothetical protein